MAPASLIVVYQQNDRPVPKLGTSLTAVCQQTILTVDHATRHALASDPANSGGSPPFGGANLLRGSSYRHSAGEARRRIRAAGAGPRWPIS